MFFLKTKYGNETTTYGSENPSLKELIDLEYAFNNSFKNASVNESYDIEKNKVLKDIIEFKTKQLDEIFDNNDVNYFNSMLFFGVECVRLY